MHYDIELETGRGVSLLDITDRINALIRDQGLIHGSATICSQHTTTALVINENEQRLLDDVRLYLNRLVPPADTYLHNDIHLRDCPQDEPENAHAHIVAMLLGASESVPVQDGQLKLGQWQSVMLVELDGPRKRRVAVTLLGG